MNNQIENFLNYLLDWETTSESAFIETIQKHTEFFQLRYLKDWELTVFRYLQQVHRNTPTSSLTHAEVKLENESSDNDDDDDDETISSSEDGEDKKSNKHSNKFISTQPTTIYQDSTRQYQRLLRLLHYSQEHNTQFSELYFHTLEQFLKNANEKIIMIVLQQIASDLFESMDQHDRQQRLQKFISSSSYTILPPYQPILSTIETLLSTNRAEFNIVHFLSNHCDILYPRSATFLDARREFRDTTNYLIDGDSLLLSIAHRTNINLHSHFGNTLHVIFIIERFLYTLFQQSQQCNYTLVFFDCHHRLYQHESSILTLLRACLILHLSKNLPQEHTMKLYQFSSWNSENYLQLIHDDKPMFLFYHDMSTFDRENDPLLSKETLEKLVSVYRLFGNYHQYVGQCQLYLMNKLTLTETSVQCFQVRFNRMCPRRLFDEILGTISLDSSHSNGIKERDWNGDVADNDVRLSLYLKSLLDMTEHNSHPYLTSFLSPLLILHVALLIRLSLADRQLLTDFPSVEYSSAFSQLIGQFQQHLASNITCSSSLSYAKIADLFDGRLFTFTLYQLQQSSSLRLDPQTLEIIQHSLRLLNLPSQETPFHDLLNQLIQSNHVTFTSSSSESNQQQQNRRELIRISNPFLDRYLQPILSSEDSLPFQFVEPDDSQIISHQGRNPWTTYQDAGDEIDRISEDNTNQQQFNTNDRRNKHQQKLYDDNDGDDHRTDTQPVDPRKVNLHRYRTKAHQKLYDYFNLYGKSLTTRDVRDNQLQIVLPTPPTSTNQSASASSNGNKKQQSHKNQPNKVQQSKADKIIEQNKQRKLDKRLDEETEKVKYLENRLKQMPSDNYTAGIELIEESLMNLKTPDKRLDILKLKLDLQRKYLRSLRRKSTLTIEEKSKLELLQVSFFATLCEISHLENVVNPFDEKRKFMEELVGDTALDAEKWYRFQLEKINSRLPRLEQGVADSRVPDFIPDRWQVEFLDAVDKQKSIIIVAPTASGKTYASYYAMGKVLKDKNDSNGLSIYISPTKALINQVAGTIYSKFGPVFGIFTYDYQMNIQTCRILITIPECLEMLLLSSDHQGWCKRIRYCIFDEIHCMSGEPGTDVWERSMLLINCPMIGLSATVNNGKNLQEWISHIEEERSRLFKTESPREVCLISHYERLADLNKYLYTNRQLHPLHPIGLMNGKQLTSRGIPNDFSLSPCETLRLNDAIQKNHETNGLVPTLTNKFSPNWVIERSLCNNYSHLVCDQLKELIHTDQTATIDSISTSLNPTTSNQISYPELKPMAALIGDFVLTLREKNLLPCIVFTDSRNLCEDLAESVTQYFEEMEKELRQTKYKHQIEQLQKRLAVIEKAQKSAKAKKPAKTSTKRNGEDKDNKGADTPAEIQKMEEEDQSQFRLSGYEEDLLNGIVEEGTLADRHHCDREIVDRLMERVESVNPRLLRYLKRGVAYHHPQLNNKGRLAVEGLFRNRYVQIVFSTWTLALGVHMPTKTVAFVKDSMQLDALQFRQSSGRAGRRGFDVQGNIVFLDIPMSKIRHLTISAIPNIQTHFPTSVSFLMRLMHFNSQADDKFDAINRSLIALQCPFNAQSIATRHLIDLQMRFHCLHTLDFLYRLNLIDEEGNLIGLAGFLTHLHRFEPASILFTYLIDAGLFHQMTDEEEMINLLAYLFTSMPWLVVRPSSNNPTAEKSKSLFNSKLALKPLSPRIRQHIQAYNTLVREVYGNYIENVIEKLRSINNGQEFRLPFSTVSFEQTSDYENGTLEYQLHHHHSQHSHNPSISPFAAPSGLTHQQFMSNYHSTTGSWDLACDLDLSPRLVPFVDVDVYDQTNASYYLNSYALDFFKHGSERLLLTENQLDRAETYHLLSHFLLSLTTTHISLHHIFTQLREAKNPDLRFFRPIGQKFNNIRSEFSSKFHKHFK